MCAGSLDADGTLPEGAMRWGLLPSRDVGVAQQTMPVAHDPWWRTGSTLAAESNTLTKRST
jgi:hypothetical protein